MIVLYVAGRWPWPVNVGRQRMIDQTLRLSSEIAETHLLAFGEGDTAKRPAHVKSAGLLKAARPAEIAANLAAHPLRPLQCNIFCSAAARAEIDAAVARLKPDVVVVDMLRLWPLAEHVKAKHPGVRLALDMDDMLSVRYGRMLANKSLGQITGTFETRIPGPLRFLARSAPGALVRIERPRIAKLEKIAYGEADAVLMVSPREAGVLNTEMGGAKAVGFPPMIEARELGARDHSKSLRFVFVGNANYAPNAEALLALDQAAAELKRIAPASAVQYRFEIAGMPKARLELPNLEIKGFVDDLTAFMGGDAVMVAPILTGTGVKTKIVDALEHATPIVTTDVGAEGLPLEAGTHFIRVSGASDLAAALARLVGDAEARSKLAPMGLAALDAARAGASHEALLAVLKRALGA